MTDRVRIFLYTSAVTLIALISLLLIDVQFNYQRQFDATHIEINASSNPGVISRGEYLVYGPARCADCHGDPARREAIAAGEKVPLSGGFYEDIFLGRIVFPNITPDKDSGIGRLSDSQVAGFMRTGINHRGEFGLPFMNYHTISDDDLLAIISFLRSQKAVHHEVADSNYNFLGKLALAYFIRPENSLPVFVSNMPRQASIEYGRYLTEALGSCRECHTNRSMITGAYLSGFYAGGMVFERAAQPELTVVSPSLIPNPNTGLVAGLTQEQFIHRMQSGLSRPWSPMPWGPFSRMTKTDLAAIYLYLSTLTAHE